MDALEHVKRRYIGKSYSFWVKRIGQDPIIEQGPCGTNLEIDVSAVWEQEPEGSILVLISESSHKFWKMNMPTISFVVHPPSSSDTNKT